MRSIIIFLVAFLCCSHDVVAAAAADDDAMPERAAVVKVPADRLMIRFKLCELPTELVVYLGRYNAKERDPLLLQLVFAGLINNVGFNAFISARDILEIQDPGKQRAGFIESTLNDREWSHLSDLLDKNVQVIISEKSQFGSDYEIRYVSSEKLKSSAEIVLLQPVVTINVGPPTLFEGGVRDGGGAEGVLVADINTKKHA